MKRLLTQWQAALARFSLLRHDGVRLTAATALVGGVLFGLYGYMTARPQPPVLDEATMAARIAETQRTEALALRERRNGTILFVTSDKTCEEHRFDNVTGNTFAIDYVDCEERLARDANQKKDAVKAANMKGLLASFKR